MSDDLAAWVGRRETRRYTLDPWPAQALAAALDRADRPGPGDPLPPFWHHLYGLPVVAAARTGADGHPARGGFLPPVPLPRRMWAGSRLGFEGALRLGDTIERTSEVRSVTEKAGRAGPLVFVLVEHTLTGPSGTVREEHDIVYREAPPPGETPPVQPAPPPGARQRTWTPDEVLLFRYSALTYNGHRIHYDQPYVTQVEGYPGLIVHGPLLATLMLELAREHAPAARLTRFTFRAVGPLFANEPLTVHGSPGEAGAALWITGPRGLAMQGEVGW